MWASVSGQCSQLLPGEVHWNASVNGWVWTWDPSGLQQWEQEAEPFLLFPHGEQKMECILKMEKQQGSASPEAARGARSKAWDSAGWWGDILTFGGVSVFQVFL